MEESTVIKEAKVYFHKALDCIWNQKKAFSYNLKKVYDIIPSGIYRFVNADELQKKLNLNTNYKNGYYLNYSDYLIIGFLEISIGNLDNAFINLSKAIELNYENDDLPHLLRGSLPFSVNRFRLKDITIALTIRQSSRALFLFYIYSIKNDNNEFINIDKTSNNTASSEKTPILNELFGAYILDKITEKSPDHFVYLLKTKYRTNRSDKDNDILKSYSVDPNFLPAIKEASIVFFKNKLYVKALECFLKLEKNNIKNSISIANCYFHLKDYNNALKHYKLIPVSSLTSKIVEKEISLVDRQQITINHTDNRYYTLEFYYDPKDIFYYFNPKYPLDNNLIHYFICLIKENNPDFELSNEHPVYKKYRQLRESFFNEIYRHIDIENEITQKLNSKILSQDEVYAGKLMLYGFNHKVSFGKYTGQPISEILKLDPESIIEYILNIIHFSVDPVILLNEAIRLNSRYLTALEINLLKIKVLADYDYIHNVEHTGYGFDDYSDTNDYYDGGGGSEWSDPFQIGGG